MNPRVPALNDAVGLTIHAIGKKSIRLVADFGLSTVTAIVSRKEFEDVLQSKDQSASFAHSNLKSIVHAPPYRPGRNNTEVHLYFKPPTRRGITKSNSERTGAKWLYRGNDLTRPCAHYNISV